MEGIPNFMHVIRIRKSTVDKWNEWRAKNTSIVPNLRSLDLSHQVLFGVNLSGANLTDVDFSGTNLRGADLRGADLNNTNFYEANLSGANLSDTSLRYTNLCAANLKRADLRRTDFHGTMLGQTVFFETDLTDVLNLEKAMHQSASIVDHLTIEKSANLPTIFLRGCGLPDTLIDYYPSLLDQPISFYSCFISYSHEDKIFARRLHDALQGRGIRCWLDEHQILPGDDIYKLVDQGIRLWDKVLLCASESALTSWWVDNEIDAAFDKEQKLFRQRGEKVWSLVPLDLDGFMFDDKWSNGKAGQVRSRLAADFKGWKTDNDVFEAALEKTIKSLQMDNTGRETPPPSKL